MVSKVSAKISKEVEYLNKIKDIFFAIKPSQLEEVYQLIRDSRCIVPYGSGRTFSSLKIGTSQMVRDKVVITPEDTGFPGVDKLEEWFGNTTFLLASGSGSSPTPLRALLDLKLHIDCTNSNKTNIILITSNPNSPMGEIARDYGVVLELKGRTKTDKRYSTYERMLGLGIMGDQFELALLSLMQRIVEVMYRGWEAYKIFELAEKEFINIGKLVDETVTSEAYSKLINALFQPHSITLGGIGPSSLVASMAAIRFMHVKRILGDEVFVARRETTPQPRVGDTGIFISRSGNTEILLDWAKSFKRLGAKVIAFVGNKDSALAKLSDCKFILDDASGLTGGSPILRREPTTFYERAAYVLSPVPVHLCRKMGELGYLLPEYLFDWYHSITD
ncbi:MAG: SIS domain-containing protein [Candidatus Hydrothermarchaeota archaeon]